MEVKDMKKLLVENNYKITKQREIVFNVLNENKGQAGKCLRYIRRRVRLFHNDTSGTQALKNRYVFRN